MEKKECTFRVIIIKKGPIKYVQDCGICHNCLHNLWKERMK